MNDTRWNALFGADFFIRVTNEERRYLALDPIRKDWEITQYWSKTNYYYSRVTVFWSGNEIRKVIWEENKLHSETKAPILRLISEFDTCLLTENRRMLLPLTARGKPKPVTPSNIRSVDPFGCTFYFAVDGGDVQTARMGVFHARNDGELPIGEIDRIMMLHNDEDFHRFMEYYMASCPADYFQRVEHLRTAKHQTVRYQTGDVFRIAIDRFRYCYGLITGKVLEIRKWPELPEFHSLRNLMTVPVMVRYFALTTERADLTAEELSQYPLGRVDICSDNDVIWGRHRIVDHKRLTEDDIEFNLVCTKIKHISPHVTTHTFDSLSDTPLYPEKDPYQLYVEWGTASVIIPFDQISELLKTCLQNYRDPHGSVNMHIFPDFADTNRFREENLLNPANTAMKAELFRCIGLAPDADFDAFAEAFHGLKKKEICERIAR